MKFGVVMALEVGKNRMESLGDAAETADLIRYACDRMEANNGYIAEMGQDPLTGFTSRNCSVMRPYGVWVVISPFNFPAALTGGPAAAALVTGNTLVMKPATDTPWTARLLAECLRDAGLPAGVFNYVTGPGSTLGQALIDNPEVDGVTFTGSYEVGMQLYRDFPGANSSVPSSWNWAARTPPSSPATPILKSPPGDRALGVRAAGAEMLGLLADFGGKGCLSEPAGKDRGAYLPLEGRRSHPARDTTGPGGQPGCLPGLPGIYR